MINLIRNAESHLQRIAIKSEGNSYSYQELLDASENIALELLNTNDDLREQRIAFLVQPGFIYTTIQWGIWRAGGIAVPLCVKHPYSSIKYVIEDTSASTIICSSDFEELLSPLKSKSEIRFLSSESFSESEGSLPDIAMNRRAMILYTSGTTGNPKGVVTTHDNIETQITALTTSWEWQKDDHILNVLPLHHVHGIINVMSCALWSGACCEFLPKFSADKIFEIFCRKEVNVFMAVPTIYYKLIAFYNELSSARKNEISEALNPFRLMVSGSAALPISVLEEWQKISGHILLERYGMTEMGMAISNSYRDKRMPGYIGLPLHKVTVRIADEQNNRVEVGSQGEIQVKGPNVFKEYWGKPEATAETFTQDGWFKTGDIAVFENGNYRILGRNSVDIIKSGGYKISALEIEEVLRKHPQIKECGVVGIPDEEWGEIIGASLILSSDEIDLDELKDWLKDKLPGYKTPRKYIFQEDLPRNVMGKVTKKELQKLFAN
ncbi:long-chain fatty acid--CoA ligase [Maribacter algarum]|uniref:Long-chain fatty acid--CoA ligase n=1 Tax=Maribacter algarum (ex Zhang et al. 2020) TaxID=2578118 RepID=A0A5S3PPI9_9FLAO|nr:acyl-CoA synthetase [Maribacter algarum]TMM56632.1 long-chain fatty acid--CoA ligase [Maribacter algarum]